MIKCQTLRFAEKCLKISVKDIIDIWINWFANNSDTMTNANNTRNFKIVLLGEGCVGKTSLVLRYVEDKFNDKHISTLQVFIIFFLSTIILKYFDFF